MIEYEYLEDDPATWRYHEPPSFPKWFQEGLEEIAGFNRHGKPNLRLIWGGTQPNEKNEIGSLKYQAGYSTGVLKGYEWLKDGERGFVEELSDAPKDAMVLPATKPPEPLGLLRWVIEKWTSPEELERQGRFQNRYLPGEMTPTLREFPREGIYDCYQVIENRQERFRHVDKDVLDFIRMRWSYEQKPYHERLADEWAIEDKQKEEAEKREAELWRAVFSLDLRLDKEEKERRAEQWAKHNHQVDSFRTMIQ